MKLSKEEFKKKIEEKIDDEDLKIELFEDIEDSFSDNSEPSEEEKKKLDDLEAEKDDYKEKYEALREKYKKRFLNR